MLRKTVQTRFGALTVGVEDDAVVSVSWGKHANDGDTPLLKEAARQLAAYDAGALEVFDLPLRVQGTDFQRAVCEEILAIPFGETRTYGEIARHLSAPAQAVGQACGANPIPIIIPCHRVLGAKGLTGFSGAGGVETKVALLRHEKAGAFLI